MQSVICIKVHVFVIKEPSSNNTLFLRLLCEIIQRNGPFIIVDNIVDTISRRLLQELSQIELVVAQ